MRLLWETLEDYWPIVVAASVFGAVIGFLIGLMIVFSAPAHAQPVNTIYAIQMCATGVFDANGAPQVIPCGYGSNPVEVTQTFMPGAPLYPVQQTVHCPANPISGKIPPLC